MAAAFPNICPHRGGKLSDGWVNKSGCLTCPYHDWTFNLKGEGKSPANPKMKPKAQTFDLREKHGAIWLKPPTADEVAFPDIDDDGLNFVGLLHHDISAPFQLIADNFTEIEHSPSNHAIFAFDIDGIPDVEPKWEVHDDRITINYTGPQRKYSLWTGTSLFAGAPGTELHIDFDVFFSPVRWRYQMRWKDSSGNWLKHRIIEHAVLNPLSETETDVFIWFYHSSPLFRPNALMRSMFARVFKGIAKHEFDLDKNIVERTFSARPLIDFEGCQLGRFDRVLRATREMIDKKYLGSPGTLSVVS